MEDTDFCFNGREEACCEVQKQAPWGQTARVQGMNHGALEGTSLSVQNIIIALDMLSLF